MVRTGSGTSTTTTLYLGGAEKVIAPDGSYTYKRYVSPGVLIEQAHDSSGNRTSEDVRYLLYDHLGSLDVVADAAGTVVQDLSFDAWGQRRAANDWTTLALLRQIDTTHGRYTPRGFTGHEMLDAVGIIHMNGRIYDPKLARFLQADPVIQFPHHAQSYNRYSYVLNNPLAYTDPSGYFIGKLFKKLFGGLNKLFGDFAPFLSIALLAIPGMQVWVMGSWQHAFAFGFVTGGIASGSLKGAVFGGISAAAFYGIGKHFAEVTGLAEGGLGHILAHGLTGGVLAELQGGDFGHGFLAAGLSKAVMGRFKYDDLSAPAVLTRTAIAAVVGGTISRVTGGKFANGALTSAMAQLFNQENAAIKQASEARVVLEKANLAQALAEFRRLYQAGLLPKEFDFINDLEGGLDNPALSFRFESRIVKNRVAEMDVYDYTGATVYIRGASTLEVALDTVAHEIYHMHPVNQKLWKRDAPGSQLAAEIRATRMAGKVVEIWKAEK